MTDNTSKPVTGAELGELEAFLLSASAPSGAMDLDMLDGFFAALASGPEPLQPEQWLPLVWGPEAESPPDFASVEEMEKMLSLMVRYKHLVESVLLLDPESYQPLFGRCSFSDSLEERAAVENWARGFLLGIGPVRETWQPLFDGDTEFSVIAPVFLLADIGDERDIDEVQWLQCRDGVAECVRAIHRFWTPFRGKTGTVERPSSEGIDDRQDDDFSRECQCRRDKDKG
ncbi:MAG: UPF0149 family protein [Chlorobium sp.]|uniref:UPF0149 family protein n=1 Tax=Chlorobium sp. TaxID=1095 RepID=UPI0025BC6BD7|nr:UPF0149 family protein [Chlorobium sp.]MCF8382812.1 UPF0149 family protein [Chlorobium sp.]